MISRSQLKNHLQGGRKMPQGPGTYGSKVGRPKKKKPKKMMGGGMMYKSGGKVITVPGNTSTITQGMKGRSKKVTYS
jgi:hypothetical protein